MIDYRKLLREIIEELEDEKFIKLLYKLAKCHQRKANEQKTNR